MEETWQRHEIKILDQELTFDSYLKFSNEGLETNAENLHQKFVNSQQHLNDVRKFHMEIMSEPLTNIQQELEDIKNELKDTNLYLENYERYQEITSKMEVLNSDLNTKENRWYELIKMEEDLVSN